MRRLLEDLYVWPAFSLTLFPVCIIMVIHHIITDPSAWFLVWILLGAGCAGQVIRWIDRKTIRQPRDKITDGPDPCPRCGSINLRGHSSTQAAGVTCNVCGWIRYADPYTHTLSDAMTQPPWTTGA